MKKHIIIYSLAAVVLLSGCSDWLDVKPVDKNLEEEQFATEENIYNVLNGFYLGMTSEHLYGGKLTMTDIEHLAHYYYAPEKEKLINNNEYRLFSELQHYDFTTTLIEPRFGKIWEEMYALILRINKFIALVETNNVLTEKNRTIILGEAYGLRGFLHFDLFRLFGPVPSTGIDQKTIPYNTSPTMQVHPYLQGDEFMQKVLTDISTAKTLLADDPILHQGVRRFEEIVELGTIEKLNLCMRNRRMNLLAVEALEARVRLYLGEKNEAAALAASALEKMQKVITWTDVQAATQNSNHIFYSEMLFAIENPNLYSRWSSYILNENAAKTYAVISSHLVKNIFASDDDDLMKSTDLRARQWAVNIDLGTGYYVSRKFYYPAFESIDQNQLSDLIKYAQPLMRMSELSYIVAEAHIDNGQLSEAVNVLNGVWEKRGRIELEKLKSTATREELLDFLEREYYREFYAEGQIFFYLKRNAKKTLFSTTGTQGRSYEMDLNNYVIPLPLHEQKN